MRAAPNERLRATRRARSARPGRWLRGFALAAACLGALPALFGDSGLPLAAEGALASGPRPASAPEFPHDEPQHARLPCLLCHRRPTNSPQLTRTGHKPCSGCHTREFEGSSGPLCLVCHTAQGGAALEPFPRLESFDVRFDHATHVRGAARSRAACAACHTPARRGVALSIPSGIAAHTTCFRCHTPDAVSNGRRISSCDLCHLPGSHRRTPSTARAFRVGFSHAAHAKGNLSCAACHDVRAGAGQGRQVTSPVPLQHHAPARARSCMTCHDGKRAFGGDDFSVCARCHTRATWRF